MKIAIRDSPSGERDGHRVPELRVAIVVPCYNEARRLDLAAIEKYLRFDPDVGFVFVDDGSTDETPRLLADFCARMGVRCDLVSLPRNSGKAEAVRSGVLSAIRTLPGLECVGYWDADLATPLGEIGRFRDVLRNDESLGLVMGARVALLGRAIERRSYRHYLGRVFATAVSVAIRLPVYDTQCGAKLFGFDAATMESLFARPFRSRWIFDVEVLARMQLLAERGRIPPLVDCVYEYPLPKWEDVAGSKLRSRDFLKAIPELVRIHVGLRRGTS